MPMSPNPRTGATLALLSAALLAPHAVEAQATTESTRMHEEDQVARTTVEGDGARLEVAFDPDGSALAVRVTCTEGEAALEQVCVEPC